MKPKFSCGLDKIPSIAIKKCLAEFTWILTRIFNMSLESNSVPKLWKQAVITPLHKSGSKDDINNYRPISVPSCVSKVMEMIIDSRIRNQLENEMIINEKKCVHLHIGQHKHIYKLNGFPIACVKSYDDLGIKVSSDLKFNAHVNEVCQTARRITGMFCKVFSGL